MTIDLEALRRASVDELESLYRTPRPCEVPSETFVGETLVRLDTRGARAPLNLVSQKLLFEAMPYGVDFSPGAGRWFFFHPRLAAGRFEARVGESRWRPGVEVVQLHYETSRLPRPVRELLYDEVKPLSGELLLGLGGTNAERGEGDHFFFALTLRSNFSSRIRAAAKHAKRAR